MKKDKGWAQEEVDRYLSYEGIDEARNALMFAKGVINQLDEVEVPELPVVPQYVADYIETYKGRGFSLGTWLNFVNDDDEIESKTEEWLYGGSHEEKLKREYLLIDAIRYGYEVEKEKKWVVKQRKLYLKSFDIWREECNNAEFVFDKESTIKFTDKVKAEAVALLVDGTVEEA